MCILEDVSFISFATCVGVFPVDSMLFEIEKHLEYASFSAGRRCKKVSLGAGSGGAKRRHRRLGGGGAKRCQRAQWVKTLPTEIERYKSQGPFGIIVIKE